MGLISKEILKSAEKPWKLTYRWPSERSSAMQHAGPGMLLCMLMLLTVAPESGALWNDQKDPNKIFGRIEYAPVHPGV